MKPYFRKHYSEAADREQDRSPPKIKIMTHQKSLATNLTTQTERTPNEIWMGCDLWFVSVRAEKFKVKWDVIAIHSGPTSKKVIYVSDH